MSNPSFKFKQFTVFHDKCAMKVGTDGVLLGAWASVEGCSQLLDVGTGSGLIALMLAQRKRDAFITAIEIDEDACRQATDNVNASPFSARITVERSSFQQFTTTFRQQYDMVVSNPPFFKKSLLPPDPGKANARHSVSLSLDELLQGVKQSLKPYGRIALILPADRLTELVRLTHDTSLALRRLTHVVPAPGKAVRRILVELSPQTGELMETELLIEVSRHHYSPEFTRLVRDFYLHL
jgi:tRNA1Val (adenine37-N6)-methyltransferase